MKKMCKNCIKNEPWPICKQCMEILIKNEKNKFEYYQERTFNLIKPKKTKLYIGVISIDTFRNFYSHSGKKTSFDLLEEAAKILSESIGESINNEWKGILVSPEFFFIVRAQLINTENTIKKKCNTIG